MTQSPNHVMLDDVTIVGGDDPKETAPLHHKDNEVYGEVYEKRGVRGEGEGTGKGGAGGGECCAQKKGRSIAERLCAFYVERPKTAFCKFFSLIYIRIYAFLLEFKVMWQYLTLEILFTNQLEQNIIQRPKKSLSAYLALSIRRYIQVYIILKFSLPFQQLRCLFNYVSFLATAYSTFSITIYFPTTSRKFLYS